jgi:hypothetical protein
MINPLINQILGRAFSFEKRANDVLTSLTQKFQESCPAQEELQSITVKRDNLATSLNEVYQSINVLQKIIGITNGIITPTEITLTVLKALPIPNQFTTAGLVITLGDVLDVAKDLVLKSKSEVGSLESTLNLTQNTLTQITTQLQNLDILILNCSQEQDIAFESINDELNQLSAAANQQQQDTQNQTSPGIQQNGIGYKGLILKVLLDSSNQTSYPLRYAVAINASGTQVLRGPSSFSSSTQVLLDELKFEIDQQGITG